MELLGVEIKNAYLVCEIFVFVAAGRQTSIKEAAEPWLGFPLFILGARLESLQVTRHVHWRQTSILIHNLRTDKGACLIWRFWVLIVAILLRPKLVHKNIL